MKRFLLFLSALFIATTAIAHTINWYVDGNIFHTTTCESGENVTPPTAPEKYGYTFQGWKSYTPIEYLEGENNKQFIDTGIVPNSSMSLYVKFTVITNNFFNSMPYGARDTIGKGDGITFFMDESVSINADWFNGDTTTRWITGVAPKINVNYEVEVSNSLMTIWENNLFIGEHLFKPKVTTKRTLYINAINTAGTVQANANNILRIYRFTIKGIIDLIPVLDKDGTPCMFDKVEQKFYYNAGTGDFIAGPIIGE